MCVCLGYVFFYKNTFYEKKTELQKVWEEEAEKHKQYVVIRQAGSQAGIHLYSGLVSVFAAD